MRLQKYMALCGVASRRKSEEIILEGRVKVNDKLVDELGYKIDPKKDMVKVDNKIIKMEKEKIYIILNKPIGYITTLDDEFGRKKVIDLIEGIDERIYPVGRLDCDTSGLLLLTNDGDLTYKLTHPRNEINKKYIAKINGTPTERELNKFRNGLKINNYITSRAKIKVLHSYKDYSIVEIVIHEGKNRQIRKMCDVINHPIISLKRVNIENISLGNLKSGKWRFLRGDEIEYLKKI